MYLYEEGIKSMNVILCRSKIHKARLTGCVLEYEGSLEIDTDYLDEVGMLPYEKILVANQDNGERLETYVIPGKPGSGVFCLNGAAAHKARPGQTVIIMAFGIFSPEEARGFKPKVIVLNEKNEIMERKNFERRA
jgi:aspartate 1-decarboxylase